MASIRREIQIRARPESVWDAVRDVGNLHKRLVPGFVTDCRMEGDDARIVTFGNGMVVKEVLVDRDDASRRLCWSAKSERLSHHNASMQILADGADGARAVWIADLLPNEMAPAIGAMIDQGMAAMKRTLERSG
jgi:polyketide cyclase/dehydrase/lipid transport protein